MEEEFNNNRNMEEEFNPFRVSTYSPKQIFNFIKRKKCTLDDIYNLGYPHHQRPELEFLLIETKEDPVKGCEEFIKRFPDNQPYTSQAKHLLEKAMTDEADWEAALNVSTIDAFNYYLENHHEGFHVKEAKVKIAELKFQRAQMLDRLLHDMKDEPWKYKADIMHMLFDGAYDETSQRIINSLKQNNSSSQGALSGLKIAADFLKNQLRITIEDLWNHDIVPKEISKKNIIAPDTQLPSTTIRDMGEFPSNRTDIYFLGVPRSGKSSVLAGLTYQMDRSGCAAYVPHIINDIDPCSQYYYGIKKALVQKTPPASTPTDTISFMKLDIENQERKGVNEVNFVELSGEAFHSIASSMNSQDLREVWAQLGATQCLQSTNRKCLFFVLDYGIISNQGGDDRYDDGDQSDVLNQSLAVLTNDGPDKRDRTRNCTMSKVDSVAVIMTKCDLMGLSLSRNDRLEIAENYINTNFKTFMTQLVKVCKKHGINKKVDYNPYILTFSLGEFYVGNTVMFDPTDANRIIEFIKQITKVTPDRRISLFG